MRIAHFEALAPVCPRCLHGRGVVSRLMLADVEAEADGHVIFGRIICPDEVCWLEFPIIDAVPLIVMDPRSVIASSVAHLSGRDDLPALLQGMIGDCLSFAEPFNTARYHLSLYCEAHYADWSGRGEARLPPLVAEGAALAGEVTAPVLDLGCGTGRGSFDLAALSDGPVLGADLSFPMLRFAQRLLREGSAAWPRRRVGLVYDEERAVLPPDLPAERVDFWMVDAMALPFEDGAFRSVMALNLVDCIAGPTNAVSEMARMLPEGGTGWLSTPYDWSEQSTSIENWLGGHSQRTPHGGASEPMLQATMERFGLAATGRRDGMPWKLTVHERSHMTYDIDLISFQKGNGDGEAPITAP